MAMKKPVKRKNNPKKHNPKTKTKAKPPTQRAPNSNWKNRVPTTSSKHNKHTLQPSTPSAPPTQRNSKPKKQITYDIDSSDILAMDCEMVGVGISGDRSALARCSIVDYHGNVVYDEIVQPLEKVTDFRTHVSGIRSKTLRKAIPFAQCQKQVAKLLQGKLLVGHALKHDIDALMLSHPKKMIRDTAKYAAYMKRRGTGSRLYPRALRDLTKEVLGRVIQEGEHSSVIDAECTMELYKSARHTWEKCVKANVKNKSIVGPAPPLERKSRPQPTSVQVDANLAPEEKETIEKLLTAKKNATPVNVIETNDLALSEFVE